MLTGSKKSERADQEKNVLESLRVRLEAEHARTDELTNSLNRERTLVSDLKRALDGDKHRLADLGSALEKERIQVSSMKYVPFAIRPQCFARLQP